MILLIILLIVLIGIITIIRSFQHRNFTVLKITVACLYGALLLIIGNTYWAGNVADEKYLSGDSVGWFGDWWLLILIILFVIAAIAHISLVIMSKREREKISSTKD